MFPWLSLVTVVLVSLKLATEAAAAATVRNNDEAFDCFPVPSNMTLCHGVLHANMKLPNSVGDETVNELLVNNRVWNFLLETANQCHPQTLQFLCSVITPICIKPSRSDRAIEIPPCRSFCTEVKDKCEPFLRKRKSLWPHDFRCTRFPQSGMCFAPNITRNASRTAAENRSCEFCAKEYRNKSLIQQFCFSSLVLVGGLDKQGLVHPRKNNLTSAVLHGLDLAQRLALRQGNKTLLNVTDACKCKTAYSKVPQKGQRKRKASGTLVFADHSYGELVASLVISLDQLSQKQLLEWKRIKKVGGFSCAKALNSQTASVASKSTKKRPQRRPKQTIATG